MNVQCQDTKNFLRVGILNNFVCDQSKNQKKTKKKKKRVAPFKIIFSCFGIVLKLELDKLNFSKPEKTIFFQICFFAILMSMNLYLPGV